VSVAATAALSTSEVEDLVPYLFLAFLGKKVIHPGGRPATEAMFRFAELAPGQRVLEVGAGVGTTAIEIARRFGCQVTAVDVDPLMLERAEANVRAAGLEGQVVVQRGDIQALPFAADTFDRVIVEAVLEFVDHEQGAHEVVRVCRPGGRVVEHEFIWRRPPTPDIARLFTERVCVGSQLCDWVALYRAAGLKIVDEINAVPDVMTVPGMLRDEGPGNLLAIMGRLFSNWAYVRKAQRMFADIAVVFPYVGWTVLAGTKQ